MSACHHLTYPDAKTLQQFRPAVVEILEDHKSDTYRAMYTAEFEDTIYVLHCFKKKSTSRSSLPKRDRETIEERLKEVQGDRRRETANEKVKGINMPIDHITRAGTSVLDELNLDRSFVVKSKLAIRITKTVRELGLNQREAARRMGISQAKLSRLTRGKFEGLSESKLEECLVALGHDITISISPRHEGPSVRHVLEIA